MRTRDAGAWKFDGVLRVPAQDPDAAQTDKMWANVAADLERLAEANENLNRICEQLRLELWKRVF
jgi:hypothetical protein